MTQYPPDPPAVPARQSTRLRATAFPLHQLAADAGAAHMALHAATAAAADAAESDRAAARRSAAQRRAERLAAIEARNRHASGPAE